MGILCRLLLRWYPLVDIVLSMSLLDVLPAFLLISLLEPHVLGEGSSCGNGWEFSCSIRVDVSRMHYFASRDLGPIRLDLVHDPSGSLSTQVCQSYRIKFIKLIRRHLRQSHIAHHAIYFCTGVMFSQDISQRTMIENASSRSFEIKLIQAVQKISNSPNASLLFNYHG